MSENILVISKEMAAGAIRWTERSMNNCGMSILTQPHWSIGGYETLGNLTQKERLEFLQLALEDAARRILDTGRCWVMSDSSMGPSAFASGAPLADDRPTIRGLVRELAKVGTVWCSPIALNPTHVSQGFYDYNQCFIFYPPTAKIYNGDMADPMGYGKMVGLPHGTCSTVRDNLSIRSLFTKADISLPVQELTNIKPRRRNKVS